MKLAIVGLGGVGGHYGARLARRYAGGKDGVDVLFVARGEHLRQIRQGGLQYSTPGEAWVAYPAAASDQPSEWGELDLILFCVKTYALEESAAQLRANVGLATTLTTVLNGVDNAERLRAVFPHAAVLNGGVYISATLVAPGEVRHIGGTGKTFFGLEPAPGHYIQEPAPGRHIQEPAPGRHAQEPAPGRHAQEQGGEHARFRPLAGLFQAAGIDAEYREDIRWAVWEKYLFISPLASATTVLGQTFGELQADPHSWALLNGLLSEVEAVAGAQGVSLPADVHQTTLNKVRSFPPTTQTSLQTDAERGKPLELETFTGYVVRAGRRLGVPVPLHEQIYSQLKPV